MLSIVVMISALRVRKTHTPYVEDTGLYVIISISTAEHILQIVHIIYRADGSNSDNQSSR